MRQEIHPEYYPEAQVNCSCGNTFTVGATEPVIQTDVCSECHPFFTGEQRIVDSAGQVDRFIQRLKAAERMAEERETREADKPEKKPILEIVDEEEEEAEAAQAEA